MYERALTFTEYVGFYGLSRSEGLVLRYLADAYKALRQTVPDEAKTEELSDLIEWLGEIVRQVDSSLIDEWERLRNPLADPATVAETTARHGYHQRPRLPGAGAQCPVPAGQAGRARPLRRARRPGRVLRMGSGRMGRRAGGLLRGARRDRHRPGRARPGFADHRPAAGPLGPPADLRRSRGRSRLGHQRRRRPGCLGRGRLGRAADHRRRPSQGIDSPGSSIAASASAASSASSAERRASITDSGTIAATRSPWMVRWVMTPRRAAQPPARRRG